MIRFTISVTKEQHKWLQKQIEKTGNSLSSVIRGLIVEKK